MKKWGVAVMLSALLYCAGAGEEVINVWSGREQTVPVKGGSWTLTAEHGRELASGQGPVTLNLPELKPGTSVDAVLDVDGKRCKLRIWSPGILPFVIGCDSSKLSRIFHVDLRAIAAPTNAAPAEILATDRFPDKLERAQKTILVFPEKRAFPLPLAGDWEEISLLRGDIPGTLGALLDKRDRVADNTGDWNCIVLRNGERQVIVFSPGFDFTAVDNILLIRRLLMPSKRK